MTITNKDLDLLHIIHTELVLADVTQHTPELRALIQKLEKQKNVHNARNKHAIAAKRKDNVYYAHSKKEIENIQKKGE